MRFSPYRSQSCLIAVALLATMATSSSVVSPGVVSQGSMLCGENNVLLSLHEVEPVGDAGLMQGLLELRTDIKRVEFVVNATFDDDDNLWTLAGVEPTYLEVAELCGCASDPSSDDCMAALAADCADNVLDVVQGACDVCIDPATGDADFSRDFCEGNATELFSWFDEQSYCDTGYEKICGCADDYYNCPNIEYWCESGAYNVSAVCDPCFFNDDGNYTTDACGAAIESTLSAMIETQQCGLYSHPVCDCWVDDVMDATADACMLGASQTCVAGDPYFASVCYPCFNLTSETPYYSDTCQESLEVVVANALVDQNCGVYTAPSVCVCEDDHESYDCFLAYASVCYTDSASDYADLCTACNADFNSTDCRTHLADDVMEAEGCFLPDVCICATEPTSIDCFNEFTALCTSDFASYVTTCTECGIDTGSDACQASLGYDLYVMGCQFEAVADGCADAPDCGALNRASCEGDNTCGECLDNFYGDAGSSNVACEGVLDYCESIIFENGPWTYTQGDVYDISEDEPTVSGKPHFVQRIENATCEDEPWHIYYSTTYSIWVVHTSSVVVEDDGFVAFVVHTGSNSPPAFSYWVGVQTDPATRYEGLIVSCEHERDSRAVPLRHAMKMIDSVMTAPPSTYDAYVHLGFEELDNDTCSDFVLAPPPCDSSVEGDCAAKAGSSVHVTSISDRRIVAPSPDDGEFVRVSEDSVNLGYPTGVAFYEPDRTMIVVDGEFKRFSMDTGEFIDVYQEDGRLDLAGNAEMSIDGEHLYRGWVANPALQEYGDRVDIVHIPTWDKTAEGVTACVRTGAPKGNRVPNWVRDVTETLDGKYFYVLTHTYFNALANGYIHKCPTIASGLLGMFNETDPESCQYLCETITTAAGWTAYGIAAHPDGSLLISDLDGKITKWTIDGQLIGTFADGTSTGFGSDFAPYDLTLTPKHNGFYMTDNEYMAPQLMDLQGNIIGPVAENPGFATSSGALANRPGIYGPYSEFTIDSTYVAGAPMDITIMAYTATEEVWNGTAFLSAKFASQQEFAGELAEVSFAADVAKTGNDGEHFTSYVPTTSGTYVISLLEGQFLTNLKDSPVTVTVAPAAASAPTSTLSGEALQTHTAGESSSFVVTYYDEFGNELTSIPSDVELEIIVGGEELEFSMVEDGATHVVTFTSTVSGQHLVSGYIDGVAIGSSPYVVYILPDAVSADEIAVASTPTPNTDSMTVHYDVLISGADQFGNWLDSGGLVDDGRLTASSASAVCGEVTDNADGTYSVTCYTSAEEAPSHTIVVSLDGEEIAASPHPLQYRVVVETAGAALFGLFTGLAVLAIIFTVIVLVLTFRNRNTKVMNAASPQFLYIMLTGCILVFIVAILYGVDSDVAEDASTREAICRVRPFFIGIGFQLVFGALLAKTWRIAKIFGNKGLKKIVCKTSTLYKIVAACVAYELVYLALWAIVDPLMLVTEVKSESAAELRVFERCESDAQGAWLLIGYMSKGIVIAFGASLAYRVRGVQSRFNESKWIALCLYNMMIMGMIFVPVSHLVWDSMSASFIIASAGSTLSTLVVIGLLFGQKFMIIYMYNGESYEAAAAQGTQATAGGNGAPKSTRNPPSARETPQQVTSTLNETEKAAFTKEIAALKAALESERARATAAEAAAAAAAPKPSARASATSGAVVFNDEEEKLIQTMESPKPASNRVTPSG